MSHPVHVRPNENHPNDRAAPVGSAELGRRLLGAITASGTSIAESESLSVGSDGPDASSTVPVGEPLRDVLGCLTDIIRSADAPIERQDQQWTGEPGITLDQRELESLPGVVLNTFDVDGPVWLAVEALVATDPPPIDSDLEAWLEPSSDPDRRPQLRESVVVTVGEIEKNRLTFARHARPEDFSPSPSQDASAAAWTGRLRLDQRPDLLQRIERYVAGPWTSWADTERARRRTMAIHQRLRELAAATEADPTKEVVWGMAQASWRHAGRDFEMPLFERPVEIEIIARPDPEVRIRPRFVGTSVTLKALDALAPDAALVLRDKPETLVEMLEQHDELSPFTPIGIEQVLSAAGAQRGQLSARSLTGLDDTDSSEGVDAAILPGRWAMSVRRRPESRALRDIECLKNAIEHAPQSECCLTAAVSTLLPQATNLGRASARRHLSSIVGAPINIGPTTKPVLIDFGDLFFPRHASSEDVEVVRELSRSDGVVIQASGREERIQALVNIVSHHLALGSRVLVVSRDETALTLLHQKLPPGIRELSVSSTGSDKDVLRNAEVLADRLQSIVDTTNLTELAGQISRLERDIISKRTQTASLDGEIADIIGRHLRLAGPSELPLDLIRGLTTDQAPASWLADRPSCLLFATDPVVAAVEQARAARLRLAERLKHIDDELPEIAALPDVASILRLHDDLRQQAALSSNEGRDEDLALDAIAAFGLDATNRLAVDLDALVAAHRVIADEPWLARLSPLGPKASDMAGSVDEVVAWARDASFQLSRGAEFSRRQVQVPVEAFARKDAIRVVERLAAGDKALTPLVRVRRALRGAIDAITVDGLPPSTPADWQYVGRFLLWRRDLQTLRTRWTAIAVKLGAPAIELEAARAFDDLERIVRNIDAAIVTATLAIRNVVDACRTMSVPDSEATAMLADVGRPTALGAAIRSVMARVSGPLVELARVGELFAGAGELATTVQADVLSLIGDAEVEAHDIETRWRGLIATIEAIARAGDDYRIVRTASRLVLEAGAPHFADRIRKEPATTAADPVLLPDWVTAWNMAALARIDRADERRLLQDLVAQRLRLESRSLALFEAVISARATLGIAQNAGAAVRQSLKRFRETMRTMVSACSGPAARRLRLAARRSLEGWFEEIPCHVMPAWRVAELLPARIGTFDLVVIDHASRSDLRELTAMLRARKVVVSDERRDRPVDGDLESRMGVEDPKTARGGMPVALRRLLLPDASLRDLAEILFPDRVINLRAPSRGIEASPVAPQPPAKMAAPVARPSSPAKPVATLDISAKRRAAQPATAPHTLEEEIATVAKYLSLARRSGAELPAVARTRIGAPVPHIRAERGADDRSFDATFAKEPVAKESANAARKPSPDVRIFRRRSAAAVPVEPSSSAALEPSVVVATDPPVPPAPEQLPVPPPLRDETPPVAAAADPEPSGADTQPNAAPPAPVAQAALESTIDTPVSTEAAEQPQQHAASSESRIHRSLVEMAFQATESATAPRRRLPRRRVMPIAAVGLLAVIGAALSWERAVDYLNAPSTVAAVDPAPPAEAPPRTAEVVQAAPDAKPATANEERVTVGQSVAVAAPATAQAFLYHEDPQDPKGKRFAGKVTWSLEQGKGPRVNAAPVLKGEIEIENGMKATLSLRRNDDQELPASHVLDLSFAWPDQTTGLSSMRGIGLKGAEAERGTALATQTARVTPRMFMVALSANEVDAKRNVLLLKGKQWFDIPIVYEGGNRALLSIEKGPDGDRVFNDAFANWGQ